MSEGIFPYVATHMFSVLKVLQRGATESPTKPKGRPKKDSYDDPSGVEETEIEHSEFVGSDSDTSGDGIANRTTSVSCDGHRIYSGRGLPLPETVT